jgi:hypothetical protein
MDTLEQARQQLRDLVNEARDLQHQLERVSARAQKVRQFVTLAEELRLAPDAGVRLSDAVIVSVKPAVARKPPADMKTTKEKVAWACAEILADGKPRHTRDLVLMLAEWGVEVGGTHKVLAVSAILSDDDRFKPSRKVGWSLASDNARPESAPTDSGLFVHSGSAPDPTP